MWNRVSVLLKFAILCKMWYNYKWCNTLHYSVTSVGTNNKESVITQGGKLWQTKELRQAWTCRKCWSRCRKAILVHWRACWKCCRQTPWHSLTSCTLIVWGFMVLRFTCCGMTAVVATCPSSRKPFSISEVEQFPKKRFMKTWTVFVQFLSSNRCQTKKKYLSHS